MIQQPARGIVDHVKYQLETVVAKIRVGNFLLPEPV